MKDTPNSNTEETNQDIMSLEEIRKYFFSLEDHIKYKNEHQIGGSDKVITWEGKLNDQALYLYGTKHSLDSQDKQYDYLENRFSEFYEKYKDEKIVILSEGGVRTLFDTDTRDLSITRDGEPGLLAWLAKTYNVAIETPEPDEIDEVNLLAEHFDILAILYYFVGRVIYRKLKTGETLSVASERGKQRISTLWPGSNLTFEEIHKKIFPEKTYQELSWEWLKPLMSPLEPERSIVNKVSAGENDLIRDPYIVQQILRWNSKGYNVFLAYGRDHLIKRQPLLQYRDKETIGKFI